MERPMYGYGQIPLPEQGVSLSPLPVQLKQGLLASAILAGLSIASATWLFLYLTWRIVKWKFFPRRRPRPTPDDRFNVDLSLGLSEEHYRQYIQSTQASRGGRTAPLRRLSSGTVITTKTAVTTAEAASVLEDEHSNPIIILIYHLLLADVQQSAAFVISAYWLQYDGIYVPSVPCYAQGWLLGVAKLAAAGFLSIISINTYLALVWGYKASRRSIYIAIALNWVFSYGCTLGGVLGTKTGLAQGGYYTRAGAWCWINPRYESLRLWLEYFWIFLAMGLTTVLHGLVLWSLWRNRHSARFLPRQASCRASIATMAGCLKIFRRVEKVESQAEELGRPSGHHPAFLLYPLVYVVCVAPLAIARCVDMSRGSGSVNPGYYMVAGALLACHGWLNVLLWTTTVIFVSPSDAKETGLDRFAFMRTPHERRFGNMIWVEGGTSASETPGGGPPPTVIARMRAWRMQRLPFFRSGRSDIPRHGRPSRSFRNSLAASGYPGPNSISQESLQRSVRGEQEVASMPEGTLGGIQMEVVTTIVVEREEDVGFGHADFLGFPHEAPARSVHTTSQKASLEGYDDWRT
ncbi:uncharacterized protein B0I36DRAFT_77609 [Microdochium trichocladiopsis]|uniref:Glucose receptor Git3 N-terminal domain-containing protein n=1 Tax=Microdochium trichocladiopsis TaxID=1682393 RepID=A0A9P9BUL1_9PEZI|nr:uncharacterized protein B0I36DRAFT_77609 [Microdochium trichocladiopsis]KAH7038262.1 hypothetical protein B0I36DRAFT_77609 [Microdochium trichocladiopsis]